MTAAKVFLRACAAIEPGDWEGWRPRLEALNGADWERIERLATRHGFIGLVARSLDWMHQATGLRAPILDRLASSRQGQLVQLLRYRRAARVAVQALLAADIRCVVYKGAVLAEEVYGDLSLRAFRDCDLLVPSDQARAACRMLEQLGYRITSQGIDHQMASNRQAIAMRDAEGFTIDLHWNIASDEILPKDVGLLWRHCRPPGNPHTFPGWRLSPELTLINLAVHFHRHDYEEIKSLVDFYRAAVALGPSIDVPDLLRTARGLDMLPMVDLAARLSQQILLPRSIFARLAVTAPSLRRQIACRLLNERSLLRAQKRPPAVNRLRRLLYCGSAAASLRGFRTMLAPGPSQLALRFGRGFDWQMYPHYYLLQAYRVLSRSRVPLEELFLRLRSRPKAKLFGRG